MRPVAGTRTHGLVLDAAEARLAELAASPDRVVVEVMAAAMYETASSVAGWGDFKHQQLMKAEHDVWLLCAWSALLAARAHKQQQQDGGRG